MKTHPRPEPQDAGDLETLVGASVERALARYRSASSIDARLWHPRAEARSRYAAALNPDAADRVFLIARLGEEGPWRLRFRLGDTALDLSTGTDDLDEARAIRATVQAEVTEGRFEPHSATRAAVEAGVLAVIDALGQALWASCQTRPAPGTHGGLERQDLGIDGAEPGHG